MAGVERLRELGNDYAEHSWSEAGKSRGRLMLDIADQIERECACDADTIENVRLIVGGVIDDMERHVSGVEGADDSPVARWARELREALDAGRDPADERDAIAWVREHGGIAYVKDAWNVRRNLDRQLEKAQAKVERQQRHIESIQSKLSERREHIENIANDVRNQCLAFGVDVSECDDEFDMLHDLNEALSKRLMPEGMEWPRYESGEPVGFGDEVSRLGEVFSISLYCDGSFALNFHAYSKGERVRRPAKVLDADGVEIREGETVWHIRTGDEYSVIGVPSKSVINVSKQLDGREMRGVVSPHSLTHRAPVLAADGEPLEVGQTVWHVVTGRKYTVMDCTNGGAHLSRDGKPAGYCRAEYLTHQRPVLDADGVPIKVGDTVYEVGENYPPFIVGGLPEPGAYRAVKVEYPNGNFTSLDPERLTHTKPEIDSWERIEADVMVDAKDYCESRGIRSEYPKHSGKAKCEDLVRRCRALAERERGE